MWSWIPDDPSAIVILLGLSSGPYLVKKCIDPVFLCTVAVLLHKDQDRRDDAQETMRILLSPSRRRALPRKSRERERRTPPDHGTP